MYRRVMLLLSLFLGIQAESQEPSQPVMLGGVVPLVADDGSHLIVVGAENQAVFAAGQYAMIRLNVEDMSIQWTVPGVSSRRLDGPVLPPRLLAVADGVVSVSSDGVIRFTHLADGEERWRGRVQGGAAALCQRQGVVVVDQLDGTTISLTLEDGTERASGDHSCQTPPVSDGAASERLYEGYRIQERIDVGSNRSIAVLRDSLGGSEYRIAGLDGERVVWRRSLATPDRLDVAATGPVILDVHGEYGFLTYLGAMGRPRVQKFQIRTGRVVWVTELDETASIPQSISNRGGVTVLALSTSVVVLDQQSGVVTGQWGLL